MNADSVRSLELFIKSGFGDTILETKNVILNLIVKNVLFRKKKKN